MVHALDEAWRVLTDHGIMIDVRPLCVDVPLEIVAQERVETAGMIDSSPEKDLDIAADQAIEIVLTKRRYVEKRVENFDFAYWWETVKDMRADIDEFWQEDVIIGEELWEQARKMFTGRLPAPKLRVRLRMKLGIYDKIISIAD